MVVDVVVIGSGAIGSSIAFHLARRGRSVLLLERFALASQTSPRAAGVTAHVPIDDALAPIALRSIEKLLKFKDETGVSLRLHQNGAIKVSRADNDGGVIGADIERGSRLGVDVRGISAAEARQLVPWLEVDPTAHLWYTPDEWYLDPPDIPRGYIEAARRLGAVMLPETEVTGFETEGNRIRYVLSAFEKIEARWVVCAAGAWTRALVDKVGVRLPLVPTRHQALVTEPLDFVNAWDPTIRVLDAGVYLRPEGHGLMFGAYEGTPLQLPLLEGADLTIDRLPLDAAPLLKKIDEVSDLFPGVLPIRLRELRGGLPTITPDGHFIIDRLEAPQNMYVVSGCNVMGLFCSPALGEFVADWVVTEAPPIDLTAFNLERFKGRYFDDGDLSAACRRAYAHKWAAHS